jgi:hypothetical protein
MLGVQSLACYESNFNLDILHAWFHKLGCVVLDRPLDW